MLMKVKNLFFAPVCECLPSSWQTWTWPSRGSSGNESCWCWTWRAVCSPGPSSRRGCLDAPREASSAERSAPAGYAWKQASWSIEFESMIIYLNSQVVSQELGADSDAPKLVLARLQRAKVLFANIWCYLKRFQQVIQQRRERNETGSTCKLLKKY